MHELSITQGIVDICLQSAAGRRVKEVVVEIGALSGVLADAVEFCFPACSAGTLLEGATLVVAMVPGYGSCNGCGAAFPVRRYLDPCPRCGAFGVAVTAGEELRVKELEVE